MLSRSNLLYVPVLNFCNTFPLPQTPCNADEDLDARRNPQRGSKACLAAAKNETAYQSAPEENDGAHHSSNLLLLALEKPAPCSALSPTLPRAKRLADQIMIGQGKNDGWNLRDPENSAQTDLSGAFESKDRDAQEIKIVTAWTFWWPGSEHGAYYA